MLSNQSSRTLKFAVSHQRSTEGDSSNVGPQVGHNLGEVGCRVSCEVGVLHHVLGHAGEHGCQTHQTVESGHKLRQVRDLDLLSDGQTCKGGANKKGEFRPAGKRVTSDEAVCVCLCVDVNLECKLGEGCVEGMFWAG